MGPGGEWGGTVGQFGCAQSGCVGGQRIALRVRYCETGNPSSCGSSSRSNELAVFDNSLPEAPQPAQISADRLPLTASGSMRCDRNCPPQIPTDPATGAARYAAEYAWVKAGADGQVAQEGWSRTIADYDCSSRGCSAGDSVALLSRLCAVSGPVRCGGYAASNSLRIDVEIPPGTWEGKGIDLSYGIIALALAFGLLAAAYMGSYAFGLPHVRPIIQDEILQVMATGAILIGIVGVGAVVDGYLLSFLRATGDAAHPNAMAAANDVLVSLESKTASVLDGLSGASIELGREASRGIFCNFLGVGFTIVNCGPFNAFRGSLTASAFAASVALADVYAQQFLLSFAKNTAFAFVIPLGLFLRCFKTSRKAGGALISIGFGFYTIFPLMVVATESLLHGSNPSVPAGMPALGECRPEEPDVDVSRSQFNGYAGQLTDFGRAENLAYIVLVRDVLQSILNVMVTLAFVREFAHVIGSEIDVSALARIS